MNNYNQEAEDISVGNKKINFLFMLVILISTQSGCAQFSSQYGDGSSGDLVISGNANWAIPPAGNNLNFANFVVDSGSRLMVPAGTTIRCTGEFKNKGSIIVSNANNGGLYYIFKGHAYPIIRQAGKGDASFPAGIPEGHTAGGVNLFGGSAGEGINKTVVASSFNHFKIGGGGGAGTAGGPGGGGGGLLKIYCRGSITNIGVITANGEPGGDSGAGPGGGTGSGGGGGGGIVILASSKSVNNFGNIIVNGGDGANSSTTSSGASGGGGGGIIIMAAPTITNTGTTSVTGGSSGTNGTTLLSPIHSGGGGGGASGGYGGKGGNVGNTNITEPAFNGSDGFVLEITANPSHML